MGENHGKECASKREYTREVMKPNEKTMIAVVRALVIDFWEDDRRGGQGRLPVFVRRREPPRSFSVFPVPSLGGEPLFV
ncbi:MAG: hypothetical protein [Siphoviridae sp. ctpQM7]|nr:MAG: hypothetical protein [Siphoviridae sp. ctpQM7]